ncbi:glycosyltransferase family 2 protein [Pseudomaricurvus alkylphenolicus]|nr:glycosyltransferase family 2 protein [Pseudomaricurvus alkylphenolicus]
MVNDGATNETLAEYRKLEKKYENAQFHYLVHRANGHGPGYSRNYGAAQASGRYLCFLDDDDYWSDHGHLSRAKRSIQNYEGEVDLFLTNQEAFDVQGTQILPNPWINDLTARLPVAIDSEGTRVVQPPFLLTSRGFPHLNCTIFRRDFYTSIGGIDENLGYEEDRDAYLRGIDVAEHILLNPAVVSYHRVPDLQKSENVSTKLPQYRKRIYQLSVYEKGALTAKSSEIREFCSRGKGYQLKHLAQLLESEKRYKLAARYAWQGFAILPTLPWLAKSTYLTLRAIFE